MKRFLPKIPLSIFLTLVVLLVTTFALPCAPVQAAATPEAWAVVIGISTYQNLANLSYIADGAEAVAGKISPTWGSSHVRVLTNSQATRNAILGAIDWLANNAAQEDTVLFFFSGRGDSGYIKPYDSQDTVATDISAAQLDSAFNAVDSDNIVIIMDTGDSGLFKNDLSQNGRVVLMGNDSGLSGLGWISNTLQNSVFVNFLLEAFDNFSAVDDNNDYAFTAEELFDYAGPATTDYELNHGYPSAWVDTPVIDDRYSGELALLNKFVFKTNTGLPVGSTVLTLDGTDTSSQSMERLWIPGTTHTIAAAQAINSGDNTRYVFTGWSDGESSNTRTITKGSYTANYQKEQRLQVISSWGSPLGAGWYKQGDDATFSVTSYVETSNTKHYFTGWSGDYSGTSSTGSLTMSSPKTVTANWRHEYLLTINSDYGEPTGAGWYEEGKKASVSVGATQGFIVRQIFDGWTGNINTTQADYEITMNSPQVITAVWHTDFMQLYIVIAVVVVVIGGGVTAFILLRRRGPTGTTL